MNPIRVKLASLMDATVKNRYNWHYALVRPEGQGITESRARTGYVLADCSAGCGILCKLAGAPNCLAVGPFDGYGNTGTSYQYLKSKGYKVSKASDLQVGDVIIYGPSYATHHMVMVRIPGADPLVWSNGWEQAPEFIHHSVQVSHQPSPANYFRIMPKDVAEVPKPVDTFWDWLAWYLGEGPYKGHKRDPKRRPNVPKSISDEWWEKEKKFIEARKKTYS
jgi:hypothetical protein